MLPEKWKTLWNLLAKIWERCWFCIFFLSVFHVGSVTRSFSISLFLSLCIRYDIIEKIYKQTCIMSLTNINRNSNKMMSRKYSRRKHTEIVQKEEKYWSATNLFIITWIYCDQDNGMERWTSYESCCGMRA